MEYYCKECNEEFQEPTTISVGDENKRCPCCYSTKIKKYKQQHYKGVLTP